ncbi:MAG: CoA ester lyase [Nitrospinota bacterium]
MRPMRSLLFSPGVRPDMMEKAPRSGADALIFDLEDSVPRDRRAEARRHVSEALQRPGNPRVYVRVNHPSTGETEADMEALGAGRAEGVILSKAERPEDVVLLDRLLASLERRLGLAPDSLVLIPLVESCLGLRFCYEMATAARRVGSLAFSGGEEGDFMVDLGGRWTPEGHAFLYPRSRLVCEARAAGLGWPLDGVFMNLKDDEALRRECRLVRALGYLGKMAIHPRQIPIIHKVFTPSEEEAEYARGLVAAFREAEAAGRAAVQFRGMMVDYANVKRAERVLAVADALPRPGEAR